MLRVRFPSCPPLENTMFNYCKLCNSCMLYRQMIWDSALPTAYDYKCRLCPEYNILLASDRMTIETEGIRVGNYKLVYYPHKKMANLWKDNKDALPAFEKVHSFATNELT